MKDLEARKKLLVAESEVYRQTLRLDVQNVRLYGLRMQRKWAQYSALKPIVMAGLPIASALFSGRRQEKAQPRSFMSSLLAGYRMYQRMQPVLATLLAKYMAQKQAEEQPPEEPAESDAPAAAI